MERKLIFTPIMAGDTPKLIEVLTSTPTFRPGELEVAAELMDKAIAEGEEASGYFFEVARDDEGPIAFSCWGHNPCTEHTWDFYWMGTHARARRTGVARALMAHLEAHIAARGGKLVIIETADNEPYAAARTLYLSSGYTEAATIKDFYREGEGKVIFTKKL
jgi:ribosomal protein S18 acetylase RimI-like enzyme